PKAAASPDQCESALGTVSTAVPAPPAHSVAAEPKVVGSNPAARIPDNTSPRAVFRPFGAFSFAPDTPTGERLPRPSLCLGCAVGERGLGIAFEAVSTGRYDGN